MRIWERGALASILLIALGAALSPAEAVGTGNPTLVSPTATTKLYASYTGPFVVNFDNAPIATYDYRVLNVGGNDPAPVTPIQHYTFNGAGPDPQLMLSTGLAAGDSYQFLITDNAGHQASLDFAVLPGPPPKCSVVVPTAVRVNAPIMKIPARLTHLCSDLHVSYAAWKISHSTQGFTGSLVFDGATTDTWTIFDGDPMGRYLIEPKSAQTLDNSSVPQNRPTPLVRRDSRLGIGGSRSGSKVTVRAALGAYSAAANGYRPWAGTHVVLAYRTCSTCAWHLLRTLTTNLHGQASYSFTAAGVRDYRVTSAGTSQVWAALPRSKRV